jgi:putative ABC transport system substrate-binding protein
MNRRELLGGGMALLAFPGLGAAQAKVSTIGLLWNDSVKPSPYVAILSEALRTKGYVLGRNLRFEDAVALEGYGPMAASAARLADAKVDLIVSYGATATLAAAKATKQIPIVMIVGLDPVKGGLAGSLSRPGGNVTGVWTLSAELNRKRMELLKELAPAASRVGILFAPGSAVQSAVEEADAGARALKLEAIRMEVKAPGEIEAAVGSLAKSRAAAIFVVPSTQLAAHSQRVVDAIARQRLPAIYGAERYADSGGLLVYAPSVRQAFGRIATQIDRVLKGARPGEIPIEQTSDVELVINLKTARALGITIPQSILQRADRALE